MKYQSRIKVAVLWILITISLLVHGQLHFFEVGAVPKEPVGLLIFFSLCYLIPMIMAFLSLILKNPLNKWLNIVIGSIFLLMNLYHTYGHMKEPHQLPIMVWTVVIAILILTYSIKQEQNSSEKNKPQKQEVDDGTVER